MRAAAASRREENALQSIDVLVLFLLMPHLETPSRPRAKRLRHGATFNERMLWRLIRDRAVDGLKFRRQVPIGRYVVDFACLDRRLVVEADGPMHEASETDPIRDAWLGEAGFRVLRLPNDLIGRYPDVALDRIKEWARLPPLTRPSPPAGEGGA
jgi:very-short-patch-repair endonuclease